MRLVNILPSSLPAGGWDTPQGLAVFMLAAVSVFAVAGYAVAHWWAPVIWRARAHRVKPRLIVVVQVPSALPLDNASESKESAQQLGRAPAGTNSRDQ